MVLFVGTSTLVLAPTGAQIGLMLSSCIFPIVEGRDFGLVKCTASVHRWSCIDPDQLRMMIGCSIQPKNATESSPGHLVNLGSTFGLWEAWEGHVWSDRNIRRSPGRIVWEL